MNRLKFALKKPSGRYFLSQLISVFLGLLFSILYSRALGPENRGLLTTVFIMTTLFQQVFIGGINLTFKSKKGGIDPKGHVRAFLIFSFFSSCFVVTLISLALIFFSFSKTELVTNYFIAAILYAFVAILSDQLAQLLIATGELRILWKFELLILPLQICSYLFLTLFLPSL